MGRHDDHKAGLDNVHYTDVGQPSLLTRLIAALRKASGPALFGIDVHPVFQRGLDIERVAREGFDFLSVKVSQGTNAEWAAAGNGWLDRGDRAGMVTYPYHYLTLANVGAQADTVKRAARGRPIMVDVEAGSGNISNVRAFLDACRARGVRVSVVYLPRWYWQQIGSPSLAGLPPIVSSRYLTATGPASAIYSRVPDNFWASYGGGNTQILQFSDRASVAGQKVDANAYRGTKEQLRALIYGGAPAPAASTPVLGDDLVMDPIPLTGSGARRLFLDPPGARVISQAWVSLCVDGPDGATATCTVYPQKPGSGTGNAKTLKSEALADGSHTVSRDVMELPIGTDQAQLQWTVSNNATAYLVPAFRAAP